VRGVFILSLLMLAAWLRVDKARASIIVGKHDWDDGTLQGWSEDQQWVSLANPGSGGIGNSGYLQITLAATATGENEPGAEWWALTTVPASSLFAGNWAGKWVAFNFRAENAQPEYVQIRWKSTGNNNVWRATVFDSEDSTMPVQQWTELTTPRFTNYLDWDYGGGSQEQFVNDLASIDWIGVFIWRSAETLQQFGLDEVRLMVPEPGEITLLTGAALSAFLALRRKLRTASNNTTP